MAFNSLNNWPGFSPSPHEELQSHPQNLVFNSGEISATQISGDWGVKDLGMNSFSCTGKNLENNQGRPKLENFLGHSFSGRHEQHKKICNPSNVAPPNSYCGGNLCQENGATSHTSTTGNINGLSMIKTWLRNHPAPPEDNVGDGIAPLAAAAAVGAQALSLSMSTGYQSCKPFPGLLNGGAVEICTSEYNKVQQGGGGGAADLSQTGGVPRKSVDTFGQRTSIYRGVTRHRWTGRYEAHLWDNSCRREGQMRKGRQVYLGGYDKEEKAARAYDLAALKYWGTTTTTTNFPISNYEKEIEEMKHMTRQEYVASLRRKSSGFSRGASIYRGVTRHHQHGRWQARIGRVAGNKDLYLGTFSTQEEAAEAYDIAAIKFRGLNAVTNFEISRYNVKSILDSSTLPIGGAAKRLRDAENAEIALIHHTTEASALSLHLTASNNYNNTSISPDWPTIAFQHPQAPSVNYSFTPLRSSLWCKQELLDDVYEGNTQNFLNNVYATPVVGPTVDQQENLRGFFLERAIVYDGGEFGSTEGRGSYNYQQFHQVQSKAIGSVHEHGSNCEYEWSNIPTAVPAVGLRANSTFAVWNDG